MSGISLGFHFFGLGRLWVSGIRAFRFWLGLDVHLLGFGLILFGFGGFGDRLAHGFLDVIADLFGLVFEFLYGGGGFFPLVFGALFLLNVDNPWSGSLNEVERFLAILRGYVGVLGFQRVEELEVGVKRSVKVGDLLTDLVHCVKAVLDG